MTGISGCFPSLRDFSYMCSLSIYIFFRGSFIIYCLFSSFMLDICGFLLTALCLYMSHMLLFIHLLGNTFLLLGWMSDTVTSTLLNNDKFVVMCICLSFAPGCPWAVWKQCDAFVLCLCFCMLSGISLVLIGGSFFPITEATPFVITLSEATNWDTFCSGGWKGKLLESGDLSSDFGSVNHLMYLCHNFLVHVRHQNAPRWKPYWNELHHYLPFISLLYLCLLFPIAKLLTLMIKFWIARL